jgi:hypothetical protein
MADRYQWTPEQVNALDPAFVDELSARLVAEDKNIERDKKKLKRDGH